MSDTAVTESTQPEETPVDPLEEAAMKFTSLLPYVKKFAGTGSAKGLARVLHAFAEFPLGPGQPRLLSENERMLFSILQELQQYKSVLLQAYMKEALEKQQALKDANKGEENGKEEQGLA